MDHDYCGWKKIDWSSDDINCEICGVVFSNIHSLRRHKRNIHKHNVPALRGSVKCLEPDCKKSFALIKNLRSHLTESHSIPMDIQTFRFTTKNEFVLWKENYEKNHNVRFIHTNGDKNIIIYKCNRSGTFKTKGNNQRRLKSQGSAKCGSICTAGITLTQLETSLFKAMACFTHYGHSIELGHISLNKFEKNIIARKLKQGATSATILEEIRGSLSTEPTRIDLLTKSDIINIKKSYGLCAGTQCNVTDYSSDEDWVEEQKSDPNNSLLHFEDQGETIKENNIFFMSETQADMLKKYGPKGVVCLDLFQDTRPFDLKLISLTVIDDTNEGFPVAFYYSNKEDKIALATFLEEVKRKVGVIVPMAFMSKDVEEYFTAWEETMGLGATKLLSSWHVDRDWREKLKTVPVEKQGNSYKLLKIAQGMARADHFEELLPRILEEMASDPCVSEFGAYFKTHYAGCPQQWAYCYRQNYGVNTNINLERLYRAIKLIYANGLRKEQLDCSIRHLLKLVRSKQHKRIIRMNKGKPTTRKFNIVENHTRATALSHNSLNEIGDKWTVACDDTLTSHYIVSGNKLDRDHKCFLKCVPCNTCLHSFSCTCADSRVRGEMCHHVHLVSMWKDIKLQGVLCPSSLKQKENDNSPDFPPESNTLLCDELKIELKEFWQDVFFHLSATTSSETLQAAKPAIINVLNILNNTEDSKAVVPELQKKPINRRTSSQNKYCSKNKKPKNSGTAIEKMILGEEEIEEELLVSEEVPPKIAQVWIAPIKTVSNGTTFSPEAAQETTTSPSSTIVASSTNDTITTRVVAEPTNQFFTMVPLSKKNLVSTASPQKVMLRCVKLPNSFQNTTISRGAAQKTNMS